MEKAFKNQFQGQNMNEPTDKYGVHFEYQDLYQRLLAVKRQRERQLNNTIFRSFDKETRKSPPSAPKSRHKSKSSLRSNSFVKNPKRGINSDFIRITKIYSPIAKQKILSPERILGSIRFPKSVLGNNSIKRRISRSKAFNVG